MVYKEPTCLNAIIGGELFGPKKKKSPCIKSYTF